MFIILDKMGAFSIESFDAIMCILTCTSSTTSAVRWEKEQSSGRFLKFFNERVGWKNMLTDAVDQLPWQEVFAHHVR